MSRSLLAIRTLPVADIESLLELGADLKARVLEGRGTPDMSRKVMGLLFFENSTRTRVSFEQAAGYLGMRSSNFASSASSMSKGETLKDTVLTLRHERLDGLVMRHSSSGAAVLAARHFGGPVLNAGDGQHEHPTQALADALTIRERLGRIEGLKIAIVGDVAHSRVARSNAWLLSKLGAEVRLVGPPTLLPNQAAMLPGAIHYDFSTGVEGADVVMALRLQRERMEGGVLGSVREYASGYQINETNLRSAARHCVVMHPGPINRGVELDDESADGPRSAIADQVTNGVFVRMGAYVWCFEG